MQSVVDGSNAFISGIIWTAALTIWLQRHGNVQLSIFSPTLQFIHAFCINAILLFTSYRGVYENDEDAKWVFVGIPTTAWLTIFAVMCGRRVSSHSNRKEYIFLAAVAIATAAIYIESFINHDWAHTLLLLLWSILAAVPVLFHLFKLQFYSSYVQDIRGMDAWISHGVANVVAVQFIAWGTFFAHHPASLYVATTGILPLIAWHVTSTIVPAYRLAREDVLFMRALSCDMDNDKNQIQNYTINISPQKMEDMDEFDRDFFLYENTNSQNDKVRWFHFCYTKYICSGKWQLPLAAAEHSERCSADARKILHLVESIPSSSSSSFSIKMLENDDPGMRSSENPTEYEYYDPALIADTLIYFRQFCPIYNRRRYNTLIPNGAHDSVVVEFDNNDPFEALKDLATISMYIRDYNMERIVLLYTALSQVNRILVDDNQKALACLFLARRFLQDNSPHCIRRPASQENLRRRAFDSVCAVCGFSASDKLENADRDRPINEFFKPVEFTTIVKTAIESFVDVEPGRQRYDDIRDAPGSFRQFFHLEFMPRINRMFEARRKRWENEHTHSLYRACRFIVKYF
jgi:hypothetical protein